MTHELPSDKITIRYERSGRCFWHIGCTAQRHSPPMHIGKDDSEKRRTVIRCTACDEAGYYPHGSVGEVCCEHVPDGAAAIHKETMPMTNELPKLPEPKAFSVTATGTGYGLLVKGYDADHMRAYGAECARLATIAERELWDLLDAHGIQLSRAYLRDNSGRWNGWWGCGPKGEHIGRGGTMREAAEACAAALRDGK